MTDPTPEYEQMDAIMVDFRRLDWTNCEESGGLLVDTGVISALAAPLEAANARIKALEHALRLLEQSASAISNRDGQSKAHRTAADWSRLNSHIDIARAAIEAAKAPKEQA